MGKVLAFRLPIQSEQILDLFIQKTLGIRVPKTRVCPDHSTPWEAFCDAYFARSPVSVWVASRGFGGKSFLLALLSWVEAVTLGADVVILGGSGEQSKRVHEHMMQFWSSPNLQSSLLMGDPTQWETRLRNGSKITALTASQRSVRGPHPQRLRLDEVDEMELRIMDASLGQPLSRAGIASQIVMSSTYQNPDGTMAEVLRRARISGWRVHRWCYRETSNSEDGWLSVEEVERKKMQIPKHMWEWEYELQEPAPSNRIFDDSLRELFVLGEDWIPGELFQYVEVEPPLPDAMYATSADWAKKKDFSVYTVLRIDVDPMRVVAWERRAREPWQNMIQRLDELNRRFHTTKSAHDATGVGDVVGDYLDTMSHGIVFTPKVRERLLMQAITKVQQQKILFPKVKFLYDELRFTTVDDVYGSGHLPDSLSSLALAISASNQHIGIFV